jgi:hypothetical protein
LGVRVLGIGKKVFADKAGLAMLALASWAISVIDSSGIRTKIGRCTYYES